MRPSPRLILRALLLDLLKPHRRLLLQAKGERVGLAPLGLRGGLVRELLAASFSARARRSTSRSRTSSSCWR